MDISIDGRGDGFPTVSVSSDQRDRYWDLCMLPADTTDDIFFFGGKDYLRLFATLTSSIKATKTVFYNSKHVPKMPGYALRRFETGIQTSWHYECAKTFADSARQAHR
jgi:hypothetical protein